MASGVPDLVEPDAEPVSASALLEEAVAAQALRAFSGLPYAPGILEARAPSGLRCYTVWSFPTAPHLRGVWIGALTAKTAWYAILRNVPGGRYPGSGLRLCVFDTIEEAVNAWSRRGPAVTRGTSIPAFHLAF